MRVLQWRASAFVCTLSPVCPPCSRWGASTCACTPWTSLSPVTPHSLPFPLLQCVLKRWESISGGDERAVSGRLAVIDEFLPVTVPGSPRAAGNHIPVIVPSSDAAVAPAGLAPADVAGGASGAGVAASAAAPALSGAVSAACAAGGADAGSDVQWRRSAGVEGGLLRVLRDELRVVARDGGRIAAYVEQHSLKTAVHHVRLWLQVVKREWDRFMPVDDDSSVGWLPV